MRDGGAVVFEMSSARLGFGFGTKEERRFLAKMER